MSPQWGLLSSTNFNKFVLSIESKSDCFRRKVVGNVEKKTAVVVERNGSF